MLTHPTLDQLNQLGLFGMAKAFDEVAASGDAAALPHLDWLALLLDREMTYRHDRKLTARLRYARLRRPGTFGIYEDLHGFNDGAALTDAIKARCRSVFGTPGYQFVCKLYKDKNSRSAAKKFVKARRTYYIDRIRQEAKSKGLKPLERATARFATVYAAGCLAIKYGIFTWSRKDLFRAVLSCQLDGLAAARGKTDQVTNLRSRLTNYLVANRRRFVSLNGEKLSSSDHEFGSVPGYAHTHNGIDWFYLTSDQLKSIIGTDKAAARLKRRLVEQGSMASTGKRALVQRPIFKAKGNKGYRWVHAFRAALLENSIDAPRRRALNKNK